MTSAPTLAPETLARLKDAAGEGGWSDDADRLAGKLTEWRGRWTGTTPLLLLPRDTATVARLVSVCAETRTAITPQGGNTGLVGGQIPQGEVLLSLERMRAVRALDLDDDAIVVEAGATLASVQDAADAAGRHFPSASRRRGRPPSAAWCRPTPAAWRCCAMGPCASWCWAWRPCFPTAASGTG